MMLTTPHALTLAAMLFAGAATSIGVATSAVGVTPSTGDFATPSGGGAMAFDFGTGEGKTTVAAAGFTTVESRDAKVVDAPNGVQLARTDDNDGFQVVGFLRTHDELGGGKTNDFTISTQITVVTYDVEQSHNQRVGGIHLFAQTANRPGVNGTGIAAQLRGQRGSDGDLIELRTGVDGELLASAKWTGANRAGINLAQGGRYRLTVTGKYSGPNLELALTVSQLDGSDAQTLRHTVTAADFAGTYFGGTGRFKKATATEYDALTIVPAAGR